MTIEGRPGQHDHPRDEHSSEHGSEHGHGHGHGHGADRPGPRGVPAPAVVADHDVIVVGAGAAGLAGALSLARAGRSVLVVDAGEPRNAPSAAVHNLLGHDGAPPAQLLATGRAEVTGYGAEVVTGRVTAARGWDRPGTGFVVTVEEGGAAREPTARRLLVATGTVDQVPDVPGLRERWGRDVVHCPFCHGHEVRGRAAVVLVPSGLADHVGVLWRQWCDDLTVLLDPADPPLPGATAERLDALGVRVRRGTAAAVEVTDDAVTGVRLADGDLLPAEVVVCPSELRARSELLAQLGVGTVALERNGVRVADRVEVTPTGATTVPGVYAAGNLTDPAAQVAAAVASGSWAAGHLLVDLLHEDADAAVAAARAEMFERPAWEERYGGPDAMWSGRVNAVLAAEAAGLPPGRALDVGSGEGGDALWLAERGWTVTGLEFSASGRARAAAAAAERGLSSAVEWRDVDVRGFDPGEERWDLVTSHFLHLPDGGMVDVTRRLAAAVAPGGTLLVVGHHPQDMPPARAVHTHTAEQLVAALDAEKWEVVAETRPRTAPARDGSGETTWHDAVLLASRTHG